MPSLDVYIRNTGIRRGGRWREAGNGERETHTYATSVSGETGGHGGWELHTYDTYASYDTAGKRRG
jgi:hypothetical protein